MTLEELTAKVAELSTSLDKVKANRDEILAEKKALKGEIDELRSEMKAGAKPSKTTKTDDVPADDKAFRERIEKEYADKLGALQKQFDDAQKNNEALAVEAGLSDALAKANVAAPLRTAAMALLKTSRKVSVSGRDVLVDGKPAAEAITAWTGSDEGKAFVAPPQNGGSAAPGAGGAPNVTKKRSEMTQAERGAFVRQHGIAKYNELPA